LTVCILLIIVIVSWVGQQFFNKDVPEFMFFSIASLLAAGCFGYSMERKQV